MIRFDHFFESKVYTAGLVINIFSIICSLFVFISIILLAIYNPKSVDRISLRLQAGIALVDVLNHINNIYHWVLPSGALCTFNAFFRFFGRQLYFFFYMAIALNLQLIFLHRLRPNSKWEIFYWLIPLFIALALDLPPLILDMFGSDQYRCLLKLGPHYQNRILITTNLSLVMLIAFIYCSIISIMVMFKLRYNLNVIKNLSLTRCLPRLENSHTLERDIRHLIFCISLYPLACTASFATFFVVNLLYLFGIENATLLKAAMINQSFSGAFNLVAFLFDPTFQRAISAFWNGTIRPSRSHQSDRFQETVEIDDSGSKIQMLSLEQVPIRIPKGSLQLL